MDYNEEKIQLFYIQITATIIFIISLLISVCFSYDEIKKLRNKTHLEENFKRNVIYILRVTSIIVVLMLLYVDYSNYKIAKKENKDLETFVYGIIVSLVTLLAAILSYINTVFISNKNNVSIFENPEI